MYFYACGALHLIYTDKPENNFGVAHILKDLGAARI